jgi:hypothetical protein
MKTSQAIAEPQTLARASGTPTRLVAILSLLVALMGVGSAASAATADPSPPVPREYVGIFSSTGSMSTPRLAHSATLLDDGRVLIAGGAEGPGLPALDSAEIYDPATGSFGATGDLTTPRAGHQAMLLPDGRVLLLEMRQPGVRPQARGVDDDRPWAETYDPGTGTFSPSRAEPGRPLGTATVLRDGRVLLAGTGQWERAPSFAGAELYDPVTDTIAPAGPMEPVWSVRWSVLLADGRVLILGLGREGGLFQVYEPEADRFVQLATEVGFAPNPRTTTMTLLHDGTVLIQDGSPRGLSTFILDPTRGTFSTDAPSVSRSASPSARGAWHPVVLTDGRVLFAGAGGPVSLRHASDHGSPTRHTVLYDPATREFRPGPEMGEARAGASNSMLADGRVLITGGVDPDRAGSSSAEVFR